MGQTLDVKVLVTVETNHGDCTRPTAPGSPDQKGIAMLQRSAMDGPATETPYTIRSASLTLFARSRVRY